jgi:hypothetical protein
VQKVIADLIVLGFYAFMFWTTREIFRADIQAGKTTLARVWGFLFLYTLVFPLTLVYAGCKAADDTPAYLRYLL